MMNKITPPLQRGERRNPTTQVTAYQATVDALDALVERANTSRAEYLRWLVDCAEAGAVDIGAQVLESGHATLEEFCAANRLETLENWVQESDE
jgi:hypothetical protein